MLCIKNIIWYNFQISLANTSVHGRISPINIYVLSTSAETSKQSVRNGDLNVIHKLNPSQTGIYAW